MHQQLRRLWNIARCVKFVDTNFISLNCDAPRTTPNGRPNDSRLKRDKPRFGIHFHRV
jgi:hypothetical protein